jgi:hypothetical protein
MKPEKKGRQRKSKAHGSGTRKDKAANQGPGTFGSPSQAREDRARRRQEQGVTKELEKQKRDVVDSSALDARSESEAEGSGRSPVSKKQQVDAFSDEQGARLKDNLETLQAPLEPPPSQEEFEKHIPQLSGMWTVSGRVVAANFEKLPIIPKADHQKLAELAEQDDIVLVVEGVLPETWTKEFVLSQVT